MVLQSGQGVFRALEDARQARSNPSSEWGRTCDRGTARNLWISRAPPYRDSRSCHRSSGRTRPPFGRNGGSSRCSRCGKFLGAILIVLVRHQVARDLLAHELIERLVLLNGPDDVIAIPVHLRYREIRCIAGGVRVSHYIEPVTSPVLAIAEMRAADRRLSLALLAIDRQRSPLPRSGVGGMPVRS